MKKLCVLLALLLTGCSGKSEEIQRGMDLRGRLLRGETVTFRTEITADYGDKLCQFALDNRADARGDLQFTVAAPESIAGITGSISGEEGVLTFGDTALSLDLLTDDQLSPVSAPWIFLKTLRSGYLTAAGMEGELLRLTIDDTYDEDALKLDIWLDAADIPVRAEVLYDGRRILSLEITDFVIV